MEGQSLHRAQGAGTGRPIVMSLDLHANITSAWWTKPMPLSAITPIRT